MSKAEALASCAAAESPAQKPIRARLVACMFALLTDGRVYWNREVRGWVVKMVVFLCQLDSCRVTRRHVRELEDDYVAVLFGMIVPNMARSPPETQPKRVGRRQERVPRWESTMVRCSHPRMLETSLASCSSQAFLSLLDLPLAATACH